MACLYVSSCVEMELENLFMRTINPAQSRLKYINKNNKDHNGKTKNRQAGFFECLQKNFKYNICMKRIRRGKEKCHLFVLQVWSQNQ